MSERQTDSAERVVITAGELAAATSGEVPLTTATRRSAIPWWGVLVGSVLTLCLPLLCGISLVTLIALRHRGQQKVVWTRFLCTLLIISGLINTVATAYVWFLKAPPIESNPVLPLGLVSHDLAGSFPSFPAAHPMTAVEIAAQTKLLVFIVVPEPGRPLRDSSLEYSPVGAAALLMADQDGYLLATNRHVAEPPIPFLKSHSERVLVVSSAGSYAYADIVGLHRDLDLALLWIGRRGGRARFSQPITRYADLVVGSPVYVIGHPQRLFFTLSSGLISRVAGDGTVQLSAPISPGNSGGPVYDTVGNLLGIVTSVIDKQTTPNAENLNFATRADAFLSEAGWDFRGHGREILQRFFQPDLNREK